MLFFVQYGNLAGMIGRGIMIYLDANATTMPTSEVLATLARELSQPHGNPSSLHEAGARSRRSLAIARDRIADLIPGALPEGIVFTSGGTEANNHVLRGIPGARVITTAVEHASVLRPAAETGRAICVSVGADGVVVIPELLDCLVGERDTIVSVQWANSETGVVQPIADIVAAVRARRPDAFIHVDAAQALGRVPVHMEGIDALTFSGHKLHAPSGTGALVLVDPDDRRLRPLLLGGGQQRGLRSGTENVVGCVALGVAMHERVSHFDQAVARLTQLRDALEEAILSAVPDARVNGGNSVRVPNTSNILFPGRDAMAVVSRLDQLDVACSIGSACSSGKPEPSHVLTAMGLSEADAYASVRFSVSVLNTMEEIMEAAARVAHVAGEGR